MCLCALWVPVLSEINKVWPPRIGVMGAYESRGWWGANQVCLVTEPSLQPLGTAFWQMTDPSVAFVILYLAGALGSLLSSHAWEGLFHAQPLLEVHHSLLVLRYKPFYPNMLIGKFKKKTKDKGQTLNQSMNIKRDPGLLLRWPLRPEAEPCPVPLQLGWVSEDSRFDSAGLRVTLTNPWLLIFVISYWLL